VAVETTTVVVETTTVVVETTTVAVETTTVEETASSAPAHSHPACSWGSQNGSRLGCRTLHH